MNRESFENLKPFIGLEDRFGYDLQLMSFLSNKILELFRLFGYEQIDIPILEKKRFFSKKYIGDSPWPGWSERCLFKTDVVDYTEEYSRIKKSEKGVLIPEGTISICRWLASHIVGKGMNLNEILPLKVYYQIRCFRNEPIPDLSQNKRREFSQVGLELFGPSSELGDVEILYLVTKGLEAIGVPKKKIIIRIGDVRIFNELSKLCNIEKSDELMLKEKLDNLAELRALKARDRVAQLENEIGSYLRKIGVPSSYLKLWEKLYSLEPSNSEKILSVIANNLKNERVALSLQLIREMLNFLEVPFKIDLCVVRGQEYYSGPVFEVDVQGKNTLHLEVAGGGRYNQLISRFLRNTDITIPATGFAYGLERVVNVVKIEGLKISNPTVNYFLDGKTVDYVIFPKDIKKAWKMAEKMRKEGKRVDLYLLNKKKENAKQYAKRKGAILLEI